MSHRSPPDPEAHIIVHYCIIGLQKMSLPPKRRLSCCQCSQAAMNREGASGGRRTRPGSAGHLAPREGSWPEKCRNYIPNPTMVLKSYRCPPWLWNIKLMAMGAELRAPLMYRLLTTVKSAELLRRSTFLSSDPIFGIDEEKNAG